MTVIRDRLLKLDHYVKFDNTLGQLRDSRPRLLCERARRSDWRGYESEKTKPIDRHQVTVSGLMGSGGCG